MGGTKRNIHACTGAAGGRTASCLPEAAARTCRLACAACKPCAAASPRSNSIVLTHWGRMGIDMPSGSAYWAVRVPCLLQGASLHGTTAGRHALGTFVATAAVLVSLHKQDNYSEPIHPAFWRWKGVDYRAQFKGHPCFDPEKAGRADLRWQRHAI